MAKKFCVICGEPSGMYPLCRTHLQLKEEGKVIKNEQGVWEEINEDDTRIEFINDEKNALYVENQHHKENNAKVVIITH